MQIVKQGGIKYHFLVFGMTPLGIEPRSPGPMANTLLIRPIYIEREREILLNTKLFNCFG